MALLGEVLGFVLVGALWGCTNPFLKRGTVRETGEDAASIGRTLWSLRRLQAAVPFLLNQCGSLAYYALLSAADISTAVPVCNSLAFVFTAVTSVFLGERLRNPGRTVVGVGLVLAGIWLCLGSKQQDEEQQNEERQSRQLAGLEGEKEGLR